MTNKNDPLKEFEQYSEDKLKNHLAELNTQYENEKPDRNLLEQAYQAHREIFKKELGEKIQSLLPSENNSSLKEDLVKVKDTYLSKLELKNH